MGAVAWVQAARIKLSVTKEPIQARERRTNGDYVVPGTLRKGRVAVDCLIA